MERFSEKTRFPVPEQLFSKQMRSRILCRLLGTILIALAYAHAEGNAQKETSPSASTGMVLYEQNFDNVAAGKLFNAWRVVSGEWRVEEGVLKTQTDNTAMIVFGKPGWKDYAIEADVLFESAKSGKDWCGLAARSANGADPVHFLFLARYDTTRRSGVEILGAHRDKPEPRKLFARNRAPASLEEGQHRLRLEVRGMHIRGFFDNTLVAQTYRGNYLESGLAGLVVYRAAVSFDNLTVTQLEPTTMETFRTRPLVVAHRGFSGIAPENTIIAYDEAIKIGAEMGECDTSLSADGIPVLIHDSTVDRTTDGKGKVNDLSLDQLKALDAGSWKSPKYKGEKIPTLVETLKHLKDRMRLCIEIKQEGIEQQVVDAIRQSGVEPQDTMIFSFHYDAVKNIPGIEPLLPTTWLLGGSWKMDTDEQRKAIIKQALAGRVSVIATDLNRVNPFLVRLAHECGLQFFIWTVDDPMDMQYLIDIGVDGIITNYPDRLLSLLKKTSGRSGDLTK